MLCKNCGTQYIEIFFLIFFSENIFGHFVQIVSLEDNLHEISKPIFWKK